MKEILKRLESPVVIGQVLTNLVGIIILIIPDKAEIINEITALIMLFVNTFSGINDPSNKSGF